MGRKYGGYNEGVHFVEFVEDASNFKVVPRARDPKSFPTIPGTAPQDLLKQPKKPKKKKGK